jgi:formate dehydrogenase subunit delta
MNSDAHGAGNPEALVHGSAEHLVKMANDIGNFFRAEPQHEDAVAGVANHIAKFWTKRMREKIAVHMKQGGDADLDELPREALRRLIAEQAASARPEAAPSQAAPPKSATR